MLNKKLVLGSLAGATLLVGAAFMLPTVASAAVAGACANCHTMHASLEGVTSAPAGYLLKDGCYGCHAGGTNGATGRDTVTPFAPQVDNTGGTMNAGGYFAAVPGNQHSVLDIGVEAANLLTAPGGAVFSFVEGAAGTDFDCVDCHGDKGHHGSSTSYRMLNADTNNDGTADAVTVTPGATIDANFGTAGAFAGTEYNDTMNSFCAGCHPNFHGTGNTGSTSAFTRHPTGNITSTYGANHLGSAVVPTTATEQVMCISCHRPHGSGVTDLLRFAYDGVDNIAGGATASVGCESCHGAK